MIRHYETAKGQTPERITGTAQAALRDEGFPSAKNSGVAILRRVQGGYIGFERTEDAIGHKTAQVDPRVLRDQRHG